MKTLNIATLAACALLAVSQAAAQVVSSAPCGASGGYSTGCGGFAGTVTADCVGLHGYPLPGAALYHGAHDHFSPRPVYAYSHAGIDATRMNQWNQNQAAIYPWHGNYSYWRWGVPTALVVPPTAVFQSEYNWGVAQTKSLPIYHQFGREYVGGEAVPGMFPAKPYWPSSTNQFGVYPVRAPH
jgi:hypothetical protein